VSDKWLWAIPIVALILAVLLERLLGWPDHDDDPWFPY